MIHWSSNQIKTKFQKKKKKGWIAHLVKYLVCKHEDLSLISRTHIEMPCMVTCAYNAIIGEAETGDPWGLLAIQSSLIGELEAKKRPCLKKGR